MDIFLVSTALLWMTDCFEHFCTHSQNMRIIIIIRFLSTFSLGEVPTRPLAVCILSCMLLIETADGGMMRYSSWLSVWHNIYEEWKDKATSSRIKTLTNWHCHAPCICFRWAFTFLIICFASSDQECTRRYQAWRHRNMKAWIHVPPYTLSLHTTWNSQQLLTIRMVEDPIITPINFAYRKWQQQETFATTCHESGQRWLWVSAYDIHRSYFYYCWRSIC